MRQKNGNTAILTAALVITALLWAVAPVPLRNLVYKGFDRFRAPVDTAAASWGQVQEYGAMRHTNTNRLIQEGRALARENARLQLELDSLEHMTRYLENLETLMGMAKPPGYRAEYVRVIRRDLASWFETIWLDKGQLNGIRPGHAVVFGGGAVGRVREVSPTSCVADLITSPGFRLTIQTVGDDRPITFQGSGQIPGSTLTAEVTHIPLDVRLHPQSPIPLYTTGLGGPFPRGILIGYLIELENQTDGLFQKGKVRLDPGIRSVREACILVPENGSEDQAD